MRPDDVRHRAGLGPRAGWEIRDRADPRRRGRRKDGSIFTSAHAGVFVFSPEGRVIRGFLGGNYSDIHDIKIVEEADGEFLYGARNENAEGINSTPGPARSP